MLATLARAASLGLSGIIAGIYVRDVVSAPSVTRLPGPHFARYHQELDRDFARAMPRIGGSALLAGVAATLAAPDRRARALSAVALGCGIAEIALTLTRNVPLNGRIQSWDVAAPPADWATVRDEWLRGHRARTALSLVGLGCQIAATVRRG